MKYEKNTQFKKCSCALGRRIEGAETCTPRWGVNCCRPAILVRMTLQTDNEMTHQHRYMEEREKMAIEVEFAEKSAKKFLASDVGKDLLLETATSLQKLLTEDRARSKVVALPTSLSKLLDGGSITDTTHKSSDDEVEGNKITVSRQKLHAGMHDAGEFFHLHPTFFKMEIRRSFGGSDKNVSELNPEEKVERTKDLLRQRFVSTEAQKKLKQIVESKNKVRNILRIWAGLSLKETFLAWCVFTKERLRHRGDDRVEQRIQSRFEFESKLAAKQHAIQHRLAWTKLRDEYHDRYYWVHRQTGDVTFVEPVELDYLPTSWIPPTPPTWMVDKQSGEILSSDFLAQAEMNHS
jgi:hypothetical protein